MRNFIFLAILIVIPSQRIWGASQDLSDCARMLDEASQKSSGPASTYITVLRALVENKNALSAEDLENILAQPNPINPFDVISTVMAPEQKHAYKVAFDSLLKNKNLNTDAWLQVREELTVLRSKVRDSAATRKQAATDTRELILPKLVQKIKGYVMSSDNKFFFEYEDKTYLGLSASMGYESKILSFPEAKKLGGFKRRLVDYPRFQFFSDKGKQYGVTADEDGGVLVFEAPSAKIKRRIKLPDDLEEGIHTTPTLFSKDGRTLGLVTASGIIFLFDPITGKILETKKTDRSLTEPQIFHVNEKTLGIVTMEVDSEHRTGEVIVFDPITLKVINTTKFKGEITPTLISNETDIIWSYVSMGYRGYGKRGKAVFHALNALTGKVLADIPIPNGSQYSDGMGYHDTDPELYFDEGSLYAAVGGTDGITIIDVKKKKTSFILLSEKRGEDGAFADIRAARIGGYFFLLVPSGDGTLYVVSALDGILYGKVKEAAWIGQVPDVTQDKNGRIWAVAGNSVDKGGVNLIQITDVPGSKDKARK